MGQTAAAVRAGKTERQRALLQLWNLSWPVTHSSRPSTVIHIMDTIIAIQRCRQLLKAVSVAMVTTMLATPASAAFHFWQIKEVFSSADGSVQFVEMFNSNPGEYDIDLYAIHTESETAGNIVTNDFVFPNEISSDTAGRHLLIATNGFGSLPGGITPDFTFSQSMSPIIGPFFNPNATNISISFTGSGDTVSFAGPQLPKNGINSLTDSALYLESNLVSGVNSPTNFNNQTGSIGGATGPTGDYNGNHVVDAADYVVWRNRLNQVLPVGSGPDGSNNGFVDLADYTYWRSKFGNIAPGSASGVPEPAITLGIAFIAFFATALRRRR
jgi:hypothetical protein